MNTTNNNQDDSMIEMTTDGKNMNDAPIVDIVDIAVGGMTCSMCSDAVTKALMSEFDDSIQSVNVSLATNLAHIEYTLSQKCNPDLLKETIEDIGYDVNYVILPKKKTRQKQRSQQQSPKVVKVEFAVGGMTCSMCSNSVTKALRGVPGVTNVNVSLSTNTATVEFVESVDCNTDSLHELIEDIGYEVNDVVTTTAANVKQRDVGTTTTHTKIVEIGVGGMTCSMCSNSVHQALIEMEGVINVNVSLSTNVATIEYYDSHDCNPDLLAEMIEDIGYDVNDVIEPQNLKRYRDNDNNDVVAQQQQQNNANESFIPIEEEDDRLFRILRQQELQLKQRKYEFIRSFLAALPILTITMFIPRVLDEHCDVRQFLESNVTIVGHTFVVQALLLWILTTPVQFICGYPFYKTSYHGIMRRILGMDVLVALGTTSSYLYAVMSTFSGPNDQGYRFFETSAVLICFVLLGKWMNAMAVCRTSEALTNLMKLQAKTALKVILPFHDKNSKTVFGDDDDAVSMKKSTKKHHSKYNDWNPMKDGYQEENVPIQTIRSGDIVKVLKGASIPADGILLHGEMCVDESMITGESIPVLKVPGSVVLGGTICTETGSSEDSMTSSPSKNTHTTAAAFIQVTGVGSSTALAQIVQLVQDAQSRQVPIQNLADSIAGIFVPAVVGLSFLTFLAWYGCCKSGIVPSSWYHDESPATFSLLFGIACLVISCPCALGLATPTAVMVGTGVGAAHGILMKGGETLEVASRIDCVIFDKTGTLTRGKPAVTNFEEATGAESSSSNESNETLIRQVMTETIGRDDIPQDQFLLWLLGSLERNSEHPLASAIVTYAEETLGDSFLDRMTFAQPSNFIALTGRGASGVINGKTKVSVGNRAFAVRENMHVSERVEQTLHDFEAQGKTAILVGLNGTVTHVLALRDEVKEGAAESVRYLKQKKIDVWMVTGDSARTANAIAEYLDLSPDRIIAEALPASKVDQVRLLQSQGHRVAMVGDGVNDSPALVEADVGMSMGTGAEIATEASDMVIVSGKVTDVCTAVHLSRIIFRRIQVRKTKRKFRSTSSHNIIVLITYFFQLNLLFSMFYNLLAIPLAAGAFFPMLQTRLPPTVAALAMALSSVSVVFSSLALRLYRPPRVITGDSRPSLIDRICRLCTRTADSSNIQYSPLRAQELEIV